MPTSFPNEIWDGDSGSRNSDKAPNRAPDFQDWTRMLAEIIAMQKSHMGYNPCPLCSYGTLGAATGISVVEQGDAGAHLTTITLDEVEVTITDGTTPATDGAWGTVPIYTFPPAHVRVQATHHIYPKKDIEAVAGNGPTGATGLSPTADLEVGIGVTARTQASNFALQTNEENICASVDVDLTSGESDAKESAASTAAVYFDATSGVTIHLNVVGLGNDDCGTAGDTLLVSGTITLNWLCCGCG